MRSHLQILNQNWFQDKNVGGRGKKCSNIQNIRTLDALSPPEGLIQNSDIENMNGVYFMRSYEVVEKCENLGMSFDKKKEVANQLKRILRKA